MAFSAIRLARFNIEDSEKSYFSGLATPACAMIAASTVAYGHCCTIAGAQSLMLRLLGSAWFIPVVSAILCILLVSRIRMFSVKEKPDARHFILAAGALVFVAMIAFVAPRGILVIGYIALFLLLLFLCYLLICLLSPRN